MVMKMQNIKMSDIAKAAQVSLATVGRVIHHNGYVSEKNREKINSAIENLGYVPNKMARSLKSSHSRMLGHLVVFNENMLYAFIGSAINQAAAENDYSVFTLTVYDRSDHGALIDEFISRKVDGVIITSNSSISQETVEKLVKLKIPTLMVERAFDLPLVDRVLVNDVGGAQGAVEELIKRGKKRIGYIGRTSEGRFVEEDRRVGYIKALENAGIPFNEKLMAETTSYSCESGYSGAELIFERGETPDALFCTSDILAAGAMQYLYERNIRIPGDVSVTGYDDTLSRMLSPPINSVGLDTKKIGETAIRLILDRIEDFETERRTEEIDTIYINRNS